MADERAPDLSGPDYEALEQKVSRMMDLSASEAKQGPNPAAPKSAQQNKMSKKITITHFADNDETTAPLIDDAAMPEAPAEPLIPTEKLSSTITPTPKASKAPAKAKKASPKKVTTKPKVEKTKAVLPPEKPKSISETATPKAVPIAVNVTPKAEPPAAEPEEAPTASSKKDPLPGMRPMTEYILKPEERVPLTVPPNPLDNTPVSKAVDEVVSHESDLVLKAELAEEKPRFKPKRRAKHYGNFLSSRWFRRGLILLLLAFFIAAALVPSWRYLILNTARVKSSASITVFDQATQQPLKNAEVGIGVTNTLTDAEGKATLTGLTLGKATLTVSKTAYATVSQPVTVGWGSNPLGTVSLVPMGAQYSFAISDYVSERPVPSVQASINGTPSTARADSYGKLTITLDQPSQSFNLVLSADGYVTKTIAVNPSQHETQKVKLVPSHADIFVSKQSGTYDVYKTDLDGQNTAVLLKGTGQETTDMKLVSSPTLDLAALVSLRQATKDSNGESLQTLTILNSDDSTASPVITAPAIQIIGWSGNYLVFTQRQAGASSTDAARQKLVSYNTATKQSVVLASSNAFVHASLVGNALYYAPASTAQTSDTVGFFTILPDNSSKKRLLDQAVTKVYHSQYSHFSLSVGADWYDYRLGDTAATKLSAQPTTLANLVFLDNPAGQLSLYLDTATSKLMLYNISTQVATALTTTTVPSQPFAWLSDTLIKYRVATGAETADYVVATNGGTAHKMHDVSNVGGIVP